MNVVIVGAGKLGNIIAEHLSKENHDIIIIDSNPSKIEEVVNEYDVKGYCGNGASYITQKNAEVDKADILIAVTSSDEVNILCCLVAKKIGVNQTIARVRNPEYAKQVSLMSNELGISMTVNPEYDAANEISRVLRFPSAIKVESFANGKVDLVEIKIDKDSPLKQKSLMTINNKYQIRVLVCAVKRDDQVYIPNGDFVLEEGDNVYITASTKNIVAFFKKLNIFRNKLRSTMIIGGGKIAYYLSKQLLDYGIQVKIIENDKKICNELCESLPEADIVHGNGTNQKLLLAEGIENIDSVVTLTGIDETNIIISTFAKTLNCKKVITKVNSSNYELILESVGLDSIISPKDISSANVIRYVRGVESSRGCEFKTLYRLIGNKVEALEFFIPKATEYTSIQIKDLHIKSNILLSCIIRENKVIIPSGKDTIEPLDTVIIVTSNQYIKDVIDILE